MDLISFFKKKCVVNHGNKNVLIQEMEIWCYAQFLAILKHSEIGIKTLAT
jgi:hypothetical protein